MELMKNKYLKFDSIEFLDVNVRNTTNLCVLPDIPEKYYGDNYIKTYTVDNDRLPESISFELYENTDYWDLLMRFNNITNTSQLPVNYDSVLTRARNALSDWMQAGELITTNSLAEQYTEVIEMLDEGIPIVLEKEEGHPDETVKAKYLEMLAYTDDKNEEFRNIKYLTLSDISELESALDVLAQSDKINPEIIININDVQ